MSNLTSLLKIEFTKSFSKSSIKENKGSSISFLVIISLIALLGSGISVMYALILGTAYRDAGYPVTSLIYLFAGVATMLTFFSGITQTRGIYLGSDYDLLTSLPIDRKTIVTSKIINMYLVEFVYSIIIMLPSGIVLSILSGDILCLLYSLVIAIFISAIPLVVSLFVSYISALIASKFKYSNLITIFLYTAFILGMMSISFFAGDSADSAYNIYSAMTDVFKWFNPSIIFVELTITNNNPLFILIFVAVNITLFIGIVIFLSFSYNYMHELVSSFRIKNKYVRKELKTKGELKNLFIFECKRLFNSKAYLLNSIASVISCIVIVAIMAISVTRNSGNDEVVQIIKQYSIFGYLIIIFGIGVGVMSASSISIEGKNFWLIKTLPINKKNWLKAKMILSIIPNFLASVISSTVLTIIFKPDVFSIVMIYVIPILYTFFNCLFGMCMNLAYYNFKWDNEQRMVKSSKSVTLTIFLSIGIDIIIAGLGLGLTLLTENVMIPNIIVVAFLTIVDLVLYLIIIKKGPRRISNIEEL